MAVWGRTLAIVARLPLKRPRTPPSCHIFRAVAKKCEFLESAIIMVRSLSKGAEAARDAPPATAPAMNLNERRICGGIAGAILAFQGVPPLEGLLWRHHGEVILYALRPVSAVNPGVDDILTRHLQGQVDTGCEESGCSC